MKFRADIVRDSRENKGMDYGKFETMGEVSNYSCLLPKQISQVSAVLHKWWPTTTLIIDGNAHIGCDTVHFAKCFPGAKIIAVEKDVKTSECLQRNIKTLLNTVTAVTCINGDICKVIQEIGNPNADLFLDPPWGGSDYQNAGEKLKLMLNTDKSVASFIQEILSKKLARSVILKAPVNFDVEDMYKTLPKENIIEMVPILKPKANAKGNVFFYLYFIK